LPPQLRRIVSRVGHVRQHVKNSGENGLANGIRRVGQSVDGGVADEARVHDAPEKKVPQVPGDAMERTLEQARKLGHRHLTPRQDVENAESRSVTERAEQHSGLHGVHVRTLHSSAGRRAPQWSGLQAIIPM